MLAKRTKLANEMEMTVCEMKRRAEVTPFILFLSQGHGYITTGCISKRSEVTVSKSRLCSHVHYSLIHVHQDLDTVKLSNNPRLDEENVVYTPSRILFSHIRSEILSSHGKCTVFSPKGSVRHSSI